MPNRFVFRQVDYRDIPLFLENGELRAHNHHTPQKCYQTSYPNLVDRRGTNMFRMPCGGVVNDYVAFYFSPFTSFSCSINRGGVEVISPNAEPLGRSNFEDRAFFVYSVPLLTSAGLQCCFSDCSLTSNAPLPSVIQDTNSIEDHIHWDLFDEYPMTAKIDEIGYEGVCKFFGFKDTPPRYQLRKQRRMAEFLVRTSVPVELASCIVTPSSGKKEQVQSAMDASDWDISVYSKPECFVR
ncbi:DarT ssDNA thymidine ADP-ribosyltransferase family protein [Amylibacter sp. SFDW26]|uniref:DarT ssDNA thymidine ADP-ribosyltransferase family protein n=1 Tax=Amylibacter sp. SFDW26 TaxID=2652722 RepID=UPI00186AA129|nr:DarT ssDNA thymidine ADP-ribosyltransferase family protein [Amylibacter sp. SFDW26]